MHVCFLILETFPKVNASTVNYRPPRPTMTYLMEIEVDDAFEATNDTKIVENVSRESFCTLKGMTRINDEVINCYFKLIQERSEKSPGLPNVFALNTYFYR